MSKLGDAAQQALEALEKEPADYADWTRTMKAARAALRTALAEQPAEQQPQEPVAWGIFYFGGKRNGRLYSQIDTEEGAKRYISDLQEIADRLHAKALKAQEDGVAMDMKRGRSRSRAESVRDAWGVTVRSGDLLRILEVVSRG